MKKVYLRRTALLSSLLLSVLSSCDKSDVVVSENEETSQPSSYNLDCSKSELLTEFARTLSEVVYENQSVREFLKYEAMSQFDKNYDILWVKVRDEKVGDKTLRETLVEKSSPAFIATLEDSVPLLNILFPTLPLEISAESYDVTDNDLPVVLPGSDRNYLYSNGVCEDSLEMDEIPAFNVLVINENTSVNVVSGTRTGFVGYTFKYPEFDNTKSSETRGWYDMEDPYQEYYGKAIESFQYFYSKEDCPNSYAYQRDYIYYGVTPSNPVGHYNANINEYVAFIQVDPILFCTISDQPEDKEGDDPTTATETRKKRNFNEEEKREFLQKCWTTGTFDFFINVSMSESSEALRCPIRVKPEELWNVDMNAIETWRSRKASAGNHSRYSMKINTDSITPKIYYVPKENAVSLSKWNISEEAKYRFITVYENDDDQEITVTQKCGFQWYSKTTTNLQNSGSYGTISSGLETGYTISEERNVTYKTSKTSDLIGSLRVAYSDPIILKNLGNGKYRINTYDLGGFKFGLAVCE